MVNRLLLGVDGMTCSSCAKTIQKALEHMPSVKNVVVSLGTNSAVLEYNPSKITTKEIIKEIEDNGFDGQIFQDTILQQEQFHLKPLNDEPMLLKIVIGVEGMTCASCSSTIETALKKLPSATQITVSLTTNSASLVYDPNQLSSKRIIEEIEGIGFDGQILNETLIPRFSVPNVPMKKLTLGIDGMTCSSCVSTVQTALTSLLGVQSVIVSLSTNSALVDFDPLKTSSKAIVEEIEAIGFGADILKEEDIIVPGAGRRTSSLRKTMSIRLEGMHSLVDAEIPQLPGLRRIYSSNQPNEDDILSIQFDPSLTPSTFVLEQFSTLLGANATIVEERDELIDEGSFVKEHQSTVKSLLITVTNKNVSTDILSDFISQLTRLVGVSSVSLTDKEDQQITVHFEELLCGPRNFMVIAKRLKLDISITSMGSFMMAARLLKIQQRELAANQRALFISFSLTIPILLFGMILPLFPAQTAGITDFIVIKGLTFTSFFQFILATPIQWIIGYRFHKKAFLSLKTKTFGMDFMISTGTIAAYIYSLITLVKGMIDPTSASGGMGNTYFDTAAVLITAVLFGKYLEIYAKGRTTEAIHKLSSLRASTGRLVGRMPHEGMLTAPSSFQPIPEDEVEALTSSPLGANTEDMIIDASLLHKYDVIRLVTGEAIPADGILLSGSHIAVNESLLTGESQLIPKKEFNFIHGGATVVEGSALMRVMNLGDETTLGKIIQTVQEAQISKPKIQELADKIASYFVPTVMCISLGTFIIWIILSSFGFIPHQWIQDLGGDGGSFLLSFTFALAVWVSACPCAFGLATPTAVLVATGVAAKYGVLIRKGAALQTASEIDTICFDKTGTLTKGCTEVADFFVIDESDVLHALPYYDEILEERDPAVNTTTSVRTDQSLQERRQKQDQEVVQYFLSLLSTNKKKLYDELFSCLSLLITAEKRSNHPLAKGITQYCQHMIAALEEPSLQMKLGREKTSFTIDEEDLLFDIIPGQGVYMHSNPAHSSLTSKRIDVLVGNIHLLQSNDVMIPRYMEELSNGFTAGGKVSIYFAFNGRFTGVLSLADKVRPEAVTVLRQLQRRSRKIECYMVTGDQHSTAIAIGSSIGIETSHILAGVKPEEKEFFIAALQSKGKKVAFVGDGTNDGPALARANVGISMANGSEVAIEAGDVLLCNNDLNSLLIALDLSERTMWRIKMNYLWAFGYNLCLIPIAAGILYPFLQFALQPMYAGAVMAVSSVSIVVSSLTITLFRPKGNSLGGKKGRWWWLLGSTKSRSAVTDKKIASEDEFDGTKQNEIELINVAEAPCHCPVSTVPLLEDESEESALMKLLTTSPKKLQQFTRSFSKRDSHTYPNEEKSNSDGSYLKLTELSAEDLLEQYCREQGILKTKDTLPSSSGHLLYSHSLKDSTKLEKIRAIDGCGCKGSNCRCFDECKCGLRKRI